MPKRLLILGATGQLGAAFVGQAHALGLEALAAARDNAPIKLDITDDDALFATVKKCCPDVVINCAALVSLDGCERNPAAAYAVNARAVGVLANICATNSLKLIHISTDHFFTGDSNAKHDESAAVRLVNEYARTKYAGECFALTVPGALAIRTNITGFRGREGSPTFAEWLISAIEGRKPLTLFTDFYTSTLDCESCAEAVLQLLQRGASGILNVAASDCMNKMRFAMQLAAELEIELDWALEGSVASLPTPRAESLGLDVSRAEEILGRKLPTAAEAVKNLISQHKRIS